MKNFLQNLLIFFALCLCALITFQWVREMELRKEIQKLTDTIRDQTEIIAGLKSTVGHTHDEIKRLDKTKRQLAETAKSNDLRIVNLTKDLGKATTEAERAKAQTGVCQEAIERANKNLTTQNDVIRKQSEEIARLASERNSIVLSFNKIAKDYSDLAEKWNKQQAELAAAATNRPAGGARRTD